MSHSTKGKKIVFISAKKGIYVTEKFAKTHPNTTIKMHVKIGKKS